MLIFADMINSSILTKANILLSKFTPAKHHCLIYKFKFIISSCSMPLTVFLIAKIYETTFEFANLFLISAAIMIFISMIFFYP